MSKCPSCKSTISNKSKIKLWFLIPQDCKECGKSLKLDKKPLFKITFNATILSVILIFICYYYLGIDILLTAVIVLSLGLSIPMLLIVKFVNFID